MNMLSQYKGLPRQMYYLSTVKLIVEIAMSFVFPFMSLICTQRLGFSTMQAAVIVAASSVGSLLGALLGGKMADEWGRRRTFLWLASVMVIAMIAAGFVCTKRVVLVLIFLSYAINSAVMPICSAMVIDLSPEDKRNESFSLMYIFANVGTAIGPVFAGLLFYSHMPWIFYGMAFFYAVAMVVMIAAIRETYDDAARKAAHEAAGEAAPGMTGRKEQSLFSMVIHHPIVLSVVICLILIFMCYTDVSYALPLQFADTIGLDKGSKLTSALWSANGLVVIFFTPAMMLFIKKRRPLANMVIGCLLYVVGFGLYALPVNPVLAVGAVVIWTCGEIFINMEGTVFLAEVSPATHRGRVVALFDFTRATGKLIGPFLCSYILLYLSYSHFWIIVSCVLMVVAGVLLLLHRRDARDTETLKAFGD